MKLATRGSFARATATLAGGTVAGQAVTVLAGPVVSRLFTPTDFATLGAFANVLSTLAPIACLRYEAAIVIPEKDEDAWNLLLASLCSSLAIAVAVALLTFGLAVPLERAGMDLGLGGTAWLLPIGILAVGGYQAFNYWAVREKAFGLIARTRLVQGIAQTAGQVGLGLLRVGAAGLVLGDVLGRASGSGSIAAKAWRQRPVSKVSLSDVPPLARRFKDFPLVFGPATLLHTATTTFTLVLLPLYGREAFGQYFFGTKFIWAPVALVAQALAQVYWGEASRWARQDTGALLKGFDEIVRRLALIGLAPFAILGLAGAPLTAFVYRHDYWQAGVLVQVQAVSWWVMFFVGPVLGTLNILGRHWWQLWIDAVGVGLMTLGFWLAWRLHWSVEWAVGAYSGVLVGMYLALLLACRKAILMAEPQGTS